MGAVIDEDLKGRVEVCVIGTSDMGGRSLPPRRPVTTNRGKTPVVSAAPGQDEASAAPRAAGHAPKTPLELDLNMAAANKAAQDEFGFGEVESRGHFEKTDRNLFDGQDLDVPTYLRRGIKIAL